MKKQFLLSGFIYVLFFGLFLSGCISNDFVFDKSITEENSSTLIIQDDLSAVKFDDKKVNWYNKKKFMWGAFTDESTITIKIPAGEHTLIFNYYSQIDQGTYIQTRRADGIEIKFDFQEGKTYSISPSIVGVNKIAINIIEISN